MRTRSARKCAASAGAASAFNCSAGANETTSNKNKELQKAFRGKREPPRLEEIWNQTTSSDWRSSSIDLPPDNFQSWLHRAQSHSKLPAEAVRDARAIVGGWRSAPGDRQARAGPPARARSTSRS